MSYTLIVFLDSISINFKINFKNLRNSNFFLAITSHLIIDKIEYNTQSIKFTTVIAFSRLIVYNKLSK